jgi:hypothetical protein
VANPIAAFNDSEVGIVLGTALHTLGAIGFLGGLVGYLAWRRHLLVHGHHHRKVLEGALALTYFAIVVNLLGGFMRTFESDHPHLTEFAESAWVRAVAIKHVFIFAGMGAAVYLFERAAPRLLAAHKAGDTAEEARSAGHRVGVLVAALGIVVSAVLGAVTQVVPPVAASGDVDNLDPQDPAAGATGTSYANATGQLTSSPLSPSTAGGGFQVERGVQVLEATFVWSPTTYALSLDLRNPSGTVVPVPSSEGRGELAIASPEPGAWEFTIRSELAANAQWTVSVRMSAAASGETLMADRVTIAPGQFFEINTEADVGAKLGWSWTSEAPIHFDIHTHFDEEVQYVVDEDGTGGSSGSYTVERKGGHSYLWENTGTLPVSVSYRVWGAWELDSTFPPS